MYEDMHNSTHAYLAAYRIELSEALRHEHHLMMADTAYGWCLQVKGGEFWFEVLSGVFMILSHLTIWYFCPERHIDLDEQLPPMFSAQREAESQWKSH